MESTQSDRWIFSTKRFYDLHLLAARWQSAFMCVQLRADVELSLFSVFCGKCSEGLNQTNTEEGEEEEAGRELRSANPGRNIQIWSSVSTLGKKGKKKDTTRRTL